jgi:hypothetical protein
MLAVAVGLVALGARAAAAQFTGSCEDGGRTGTKVLVAATAVGGNVALQHYFKQAWWSGTRAPHWFMKEDWDQAFRDQDKFGHVFGGFHLTRTGSALLREACVPAKTATVLGAAYAFLFQLQIEVWDGYYVDYGFSRGDLLANTAGAGLGVAQQFVPPMRVVKPTISYAPTSAFRRRNEAGHNRNPRATTDYSGQTYWMSADVNAMLPADARAYWPDALRLSLGHSVTEWVRGSDGAVVRGKRRLLLSLDLDAEQLPGNHPLWRTVKRQLSYYHFPAPAIELTPSLRGIAWYR